MTKLEELYAKRKVFEDYNIEIPAELRNEIQEAERSQWENLCVYLGRRLPNEVEFMIPERFVFGGEYVNGKLVRIGVDRRHMDEIFEYSTEVTVTADEPDEESEQSVWEPRAYPEGKRSPTVRFSVKFDNGVIIRETTGRDTLIETLRYFGLEKAAQFRLPEGAGGEGGGVAGAESLDEAGEVTGEAGSLADAAVGDEDPALAVGETLN